MSTQENPEFDPESARVYNEAAADFLGWRHNIPSAAIEAHPFLSMDPSSASFALDVVDLQTALGFSQDDVDGKLGSNTWIALLERYDPVGHDNGQYVVLNRRRIPMPSAAERGYHLAPYDQDGGIDLHKEGHFSGGRNRRKLLEVDGELKAITCIQLHWGSSSARRLAGVLNSRGISTHFGIELCGDDVRIFQYLDMWHRAWHAGKTNNWTIGVDFCQQPTEKWYKRLKSNGGQVELIDNPTKRGDRKITTLDRRLEEAGRNFVEDLCRVTHIPYRVPLDSNGRIYHGLITKEVLTGKFSGVIPHSATDDRKWDIAPWMGQLFGRLEGGSCA